MTTRRLPRRALMLAAAASITLLGACASNKGMKSGNLVAQGHNETLGDSVQDRSDSSEAEDDEDAGENGDAQTHGQDEESQVQEGESQTQGEETQNQNEGSQTQEQDDSSEAQSGATSELGSRVLDKVSQRLGDRLLDVLDRGLDRVATEPDNTHSAPPSPPPDDGTDPSAGAQPPGKSGGKSLDFRYVSPSTRMKSVPLADNSKAKRLSNRALKSAKRNVPDQTKPRKNIREKSTSKDRMTQKRNKPPVPPF
ncbi:MAG: hypothetical protein CHACPFDD_02742 [Phycisphaerae bacterium]|nr:hypothetical protein [Phycisphaerae bacterium]